MARPITCATVRLPFSIQHEGADSNENGSNETENALPDVFSDAPDVLGQRVPNSNESGTKAQANHEAKQRPQPYLRIRGRPGLDELHVS